MTSPPQIEQFLANWRDTGGSELANTQSFINGLTQLLGVEPPAGSKADDAHNDYVFERRVFQDNGDGSQSFGRIDCYKRDCFILEAKQGSEADRAAADRGDDDLDLFGQTASARMKRGTARRGTPGWARAMVQAKGQAERYAKALPTDHGWPPFLLVVDVGFCIEVYADFTGTGRAYAQFPDRARYRIMLDDLRDDDVRTRLQAIWTDPRSLDPAARAARVTRDIADLLATVARRIEKRGHNPERTSGFLMRVLFTMFAEDSGLIPEGSFTGLLKVQRAHPQHLGQQLSALWQAMDRGEFSPALGVPLRKFNGYLFKDQTAIDLDTEELEVLIRAAEHVWTEVEPAIFGTLLERALNPKERAKLGAHYTPRAYVERLISPTIMEPLRADWDGVRGAAATLIEEGRADDARATVQAFHARLAQTKVLDPACGTGNFLYVAMARIKELEGEVVALLEELGDTQYVVELTGHTITPENFLGIEINPRAAAIAQLVLWIGYLQWHFRVHGTNRPPPEPILRDVRSIECRDALIIWDDRVLERDEHGVPVTRWDGETTGPHPVTGKPVPDETARVEVYRYIRPRAAKWPAADFIVGNPPFIGAKEMRVRLGDGYLEALFATTEVPESADFVMHWWDKAATSVRTGITRRFGFVTTNSITQIFSRRVVASHCDAKDGVFLMLAIPNHPWVDEKDGAAVRIAMTVASRGRAAGKLLTVSNEVGAPDKIEFDERIGFISSDFRIGADVTKTVALKANAKLSVRGVELHGDGYLIPPETLTQWQNENPRFYEAYVRPYWAAKDLLKRDRGLSIVDLFDCDEEELRAAAPSLYQHLLNTAKPSRAAKGVEARRRLWWRLALPHKDLRQSIDRLDRFIVTAVTSKHRWFVFADGTKRPDQSLMVVPSNDPFLLGVLTSRYHVSWALVAGGRLGVGDDPRYNNTRCFDPFPFPADVPEPLQAHIRAEAEALDALRKQVLAAHDDLTLTKLYNVLEALKAGRALTDAERDMHDRGLVTLIRQHHDALDAAVAQAYGWPETLDDEAIIARLVALNKERAAEEARGLVRWLRPEYQAPGWQAPTAHNLDLGDQPVALPDNIIPWPTTLPEQVSAVQSILATATAPLAANDVARAFKGKRAGTVKPVLDALAGIGMARRLADGRYAA